MMYFYAFAYKEIKMNKLYNIEKQPSIDHREVAKEHDLFSFHEYGVGFPFFHDKGLKIKNALIALWREYHQQDYLEIESPIMLDQKLWEQSGHMQHFKEHMYLCDAQDRSYAIKPMSCPGAILFYKHKRRFHSEMPLRVAELGRVHRYENSGSLNGILRVRSFIQDDAHIFCRKSQAHEEIKAVIKLSRKLLELCGFNDFFYELSMRDQSEKYLGSKEDWKLSENILKSVLDELNIPYKESKGEAKFYGPAIDVHIKDSHGKLWQCSSVQFDFNLSSRFDVSFANELGEGEIPFIIHRALFGSLERFIGILLENFGMDLPFFLRPEQVRVLSFLDEGHSYLEEIKNELKQRGVRYKVEYVKKSLGQKIKAAQNEKIPFMFIVGEKEASLGEVSIRNQAGKRAQVQLKELAKYWKKVGIDI